MTNEPALRQRSDEGRIRQAAEAGISTNLPSRGLLNDARLTDLHRRTDQLIDELCH